MAYSETEVEYHVKQIDQQVFDRALTTCSFEAVSPPWRCGVEVRTTTEETAAYCHDIHE